MSTRGELPVLRTLSDLAALVRRVPHLYVRWSHGPEADQDLTASRDGLTGVRLPGLSANPLDLEPWWEDRPVELWVARRLYDYSHLPREKGPGVRPWVLRGRVEGRGPDNEPLVRDVEPISWIDETMIKEARERMAHQEGEWGPMQREPDEPANGSANGHAPRRG
ncbi:hypothetical protein Sipo8835_41310 [Streptomyces ipomoeae]|jgi:hypothetical protein|uniref:Uncharacterized protein n=2 Tax=Streptomyces ipomoeae TaxID=103232 RepID=L1L399_9ACTN|nr:DUF6098 family protein [Streptomyces ipomoeae]EKX67541.1 hypothetical protein STRIP9103_01010 [Streptomyces ipomoeae 91-03]MDX2692618.1 DUF6098 family protein [Streptomyces ipomoeae]MDX2820744.1 DUF6098 family protein [Streptomyces ipomoeae]MDX2837543.1 DUF6098 family protein [Streptomyces ipomoeae]TQE17846.1 hypothetical protein Sipo8835_41310 [Streptomyces ipomoeae]